MDGVIGKSSWKRHFILSHDFCERRFIIPRPAEGARLFTPVASTTRSAVYSWRAVTTVGFRAGLNGMHARHSDAGPTFPGLFQQANYQTSAPGEGCPGGDPHLDRR